MSETSWRVFWAHVPWNWYGLLVWKLLKFYAYAWVFAPQQQLVELTGTLEEERQRARRLQNERDIQQVTAMGHKERERYLQTELEKEKKRRSEVELKLGNEREKNASLLSELTSKDVKIDELQREVDSEALQATEKAS